jgi:hypothetical protein
VHEVVSRVLVEDGALPVPAQLAEEMPARVEPRAHHDLNFLERAVVRDVGYVIGSMGGW